MRTVECLTTHPDGDTPTVGLTRLQQGVFQLSSLNLCIELVVQIQSLQFLYFEPVLGRYVLISLDNHLLCQVGHIGELLFDAQILVDLLAPYCGLAVSHFVNGRVTHHAI